MHGLKQLCLQPPHNILHLTSLECKLHVSPFLRVPKPSCHTPTLQHREKQRRTRRNNAERATRRAERVTLSEASRPRWSRRHRASSSSEASADRRSRGRAGAAAYRARAVGREKVHAQHEDDDLKHTGHGGGQPDGPRVVVDEYLVHVDQQAADTLRGVDESISDDNMRPSVLRC